MLILFSIILNHLFTGIRRCPHDHKRPPWQFIAPNTHLSVTTSLLIVILQTSMTDFYDSQLEHQHPQCFPSLSLPWECEQARGIESQQPIPALIAQRQACGTWQRCPMSDACHHKPKQPCLLRYGRGSLPCKVIPQPAPQRLLASFLSPHLRTLVCLRLLISITLSLQSKGTSLRCMLLILLLTAHSRLTSLTQLIMLQVYCAQQRNCQSCFI